MAEIQAARTWTTGDALTATTLNTELRDQLNALRTPPSAYVYRTTAGTVANSPLPTINWAVVSFDQIGWDTAYDGSSMATAGGSRLTARIPGKYAVNACITYATNGTGYRNLHVRKNAAGIVTGGTALPYINLPAASGTGSQVMFSFSVQLAVNDYVEMFTWQSSGSTLSWVVGAYSVFFQATRTTS